jgi:adenylate cyclase
VLGNQKSSGRSLTFVCVLFVDIRDFTRLVEKKTPEESSPTKNAILGAAIEIVNRNQGVINQFVGDGFMATFGAPVATGRDCKNALRIARELLAAVNAFSNSGRIPATEVLREAGEDVKGAESLGLMQVKGRDEPIEIYRLA